MSLDTRMPGQFLKQLAVKSSNKLVGQGSNFLKIKITLGLLLFKVLELGIVFPCLTNIVFYVYLQKKRVVILDFCKIKEKDSARRLE